MNAVGVAIFFRVVHYFAIGHQIHHYLERIGCGAEARDDIRVFQSHPHGDLSTPRLELVNRRNEKRGSGQPSRFSLDNSWWGLSSF